MKRVTVGSEHERFTEMAPLRQLFCSESLHIFDLMRFANKTTYPFEVFVSWKCHQDVLIETFHSQSPIKFRLI